MKTWYFWESADEYGEFEAESDEEAMKMVDMDKVIVMYKESNTKNGTPYIMIKE